MKLMRWFWPVAGLLMIVIPLSENRDGAIIALGFFVLLFWFAAQLNRREARALRAAGSGAVHVKTVKQTWVNQTVQRYAQAGWRLDGQSSAKSLGSQARVTLTFRKP